MAKDWAKAFYNSKAWQDCRRAYLSEHPYCERCKAAGRIKYMEATQGRYAGFSFWRTYG